MEENKLQEQYIRELDYRCENLKLDNHRLFIALDRYILLYNKSIKEILYIMEQIESYIDECNQAETDGEREFVEYLKSCLTTIKKQLIYIVSMVSQNAEELQ